jgi:uncharacterized membrane protein
MESRAKFLGHPIHPMLIPFPLGLLGMEVIFDLLAIVTGQTLLGQASRPMIAAGIITGLLAAIFGAIDWAALRPGRAPKGSPPRTAWAMSSSSSSSPSPGGCAVIPRAHHPVYR